MTGDVDGFREFVVSRSPALLRTAWMLTGDAQLAEDLLQSALARVWPHWSRVGGDRPEAYVRKVMVRLQGAWWHRRWNGELPVADVPEAAAGDGYAAVDERVVLRAVLADALAGVPAARGSVDGLPGGCIVQSRDQRDHRPGVCWF